MKLKKVKHIFTLEEAQNGNFGIRLKYLRQINNVSQSDFALLINIKPSTISQYESNTRRPVSSILIKIAEFFNVTSEWLINGTNFRVQNNNINELYNNLETYYKIELMKYAKYLLHQQNEKNMLKTNEMISNSNDDIQDYII